MIINSAEILGESEKKKIKINIFDKNQNENYDDFSLEMGSPKLTYNFITINNRLEDGYGFSALTSPLSDSNLSEEQEIPIKGNEVNKLFSFKWYDDLENKNKYLLFYFNDKQQLCYDNLFGERPDTFFIPTTYTQSPAGCGYVVDSQDAIVFSGEGDSLLVVTGLYQEKVENAPVLLSICSHYNMLFAITAGERRSLVYTENLDILNWDNERTKHIEFNDQLGNLNKIISFNDYLYIFRDYGITKISAYSSEEDFSISHLYQSDSYIYPGSIAQCGEKVYFLERGGLKEFNGSSVKDIAVDCKTMFENIDNSNCSGACYEGKYFLACNLNLNNEILTDQKNSYLLVYDLQSEKVILSKDLNVKSLLVLNNPYNSKLIACFYGENKNKIGQLTKDGKLFNKPLSKFWQSAKTDLGYCDELKKITKISFISEHDCQISVKTENKEKIFNIKGNINSQNIYINLIGKVFQISIKSSGTAKIYNFQLEFVVNK